MVQSLHDAIELAGFCVLDESPVDLTWLHRSFCALALKSCERLLPELRAYGTHDEPTACDRGLTAVRRGNRMHITGLSTDSSFASVLR